MNYFENLKNYICSFIYPEDEYQFDFYSYIYKEKPSFFNYEIIDKIDFDNTKTSDIVISLNNIKYQYKFNSSYYENMYNLNSTDKLIKLKYKLILCLESPKDTTDIMIKHIMNYKGEKPDKVNEKVDEEYDKLEKRYLNLLKEIQYEDDDEDDNQNNNDNNNYCKVSIKPKKICLPSY